MDFSSIKALIPTVGGGFYYRPAAYAPPPPSHPRVRSKSRKRPRQKSTSSSNSSSRDFCFKCAQIGHTTRSCKWYKTVLCKYHNNPSCKYDQNSELCNHAHGEQELRPSAEAYCVRIVYEDGKQRVEGCRQPGHRITDCPQAATLFEKEFGGVLPPTTTTTTT